MKNYLLLIVLVTGFSFAQEKEKEYAKLNKGELIAKINSKDEEIISLKKKLESEKTAKENASRLLTFVNVQNKIQELLATRTERTEITADRVLKELGKIAFAEETQTTEEAIPIKMTDKVKALELLGRHLAMFTDKLDVSDSRVIIQGEQNLQD
jgi:hypothetical protein